MSTLTVTRAEVWRMYPGAWAVQVFVRGMAGGRGGPIRKRPEGITIYPADGIAFPTHGTAMAAALAEFGLATPPEHREAP